MRVVTVLLAAGCVAVAVGLMPSVWAAAPASVAPAPAETLKSPADFAAIKDPAARSVALFTEAGKVIESPRCMNCHPVQRAPTQGDDRHPHNPPMVGGQSGHGPVGLPCAACHGPANVQTWGQDIKSIPGDPKWALAPVEMAWQGKSLGAICAQIKDPARNGGRSLAEIHHHMAEDHLVGWAWSPGEGRVPAPGTQAQFGELVQAWIDTGAKCPKA
ncbi:Isoquinoline 1-oxidoreductase subunit [Caulobacter sp. Root656]|nr:Isoquinoline 1-oxidoreductase subunit [Caulobacter sp. Root656]